MKPSSFLRFLWRCPAGSSRQFAICHRMVAPWTHISAGEPFLFWNLWSGYSWHPNLKHRSNRGCLQSYLHFPKCKIFLSVGLVLTQKSTPTFSPVFLPVWRTFPSLLWLCHVEEKALMNSWQTTAVWPQGTSYWHPFSAVVFKGLSSVLWKSLQVKGKALHRGQCDFRHQNQDMVCSHFWGRNPALAGEVTNIAHERSL